MAKKSNYSIEDQYAAAAPEEQQEQSAADQGALTLSADDVSQMQQLKSEGDQSGDYSQLGAFMAQLLGGGPAAEQAQPAA